MGVIRVTSILSRFVKSHRRLSNDQETTSDGLLNIPKAHFAVYVLKGNDLEEENPKKLRFVVPIAYLKSPLFLELLRKAEDEFGFEYGMGGLTVPCSERCFLDLIAQLNASY